MARGQQAQQHLVQQLQLPAGLQQALHRARRLPPRRRGIALRLRAPKTLIFKVQCVQQVPHAQRRPPRSCHTGLCLCAAILLYLPGINEWSNLDECASSAVHFNAT